MPDQQTDEMPDRQTDEMPDQQAEMSDQQPADSPRDVTRRRFLGATAKAGAAMAAAPLVVPRRVWGGSGYQPPSDTATIAGVGVGGVGGANLRNLAGNGPSYEGDIGDVSERAGQARVVALADVDPRHASETFEQYPEAERYRDYRRMFEEMGGQIDGVVVATPDHTHATISLAAMERGLAVYTQKPLTWSVAEARALAEAAEETGGVTQMGNQGHSSDDARLINEIIRNGDIGTVEEVHVWTNRPVWPQGMDWPDVLKRKPPRLAWDQWLGPAPEVTYDPSFHPFTWRGWVDWGTGALGDMGAHLIDHPYWALGLGRPETIHTRSTPFNGVSWPHAATTYYDFPARPAFEGMSEEQPPVRLTWYDGGLMPPRPEELTEEEELNPGGGVIMVGTDGKLMHGTYGNNPRLLPTGRMEAYADPPELFERVPGENHEMNWVRAIKGQTEAVSPFSYAAPLTETMLLGLVSMRAGNRKIRYDAEQMQVTNHEEANQYLSRQNMRSGWGLEDVAAMARG